MKFSAAELNAISYAVGRERARRQDRTLHGFTQRHWATIEGIRPYIDNWHIGLISEHLEACARRDIHKLLITIPPRCMKSISVAVMLCPWVWGPHGAPHERFTYASYSGSLSQRDSRASRKIIRSDEYQAAWGDVYQISRTDQDSGVRFENSKAGFRLATSVGGTLTGEGGSYIVWDDPHSAAEAQSDSVREGVIEWYKHVFSTRLNSPNDDIEIGIMQRLHERDLAGYVISEIGGYEHICIPMEYDGVKRRTSISVNYDPRTKKDELLWPERFNKGTVVLLKKKLGTYGASGQLQQQPAPDEGGLIKEKWLRLWPHQARLPVFEFVLQSYDGAYTERTDGDPSAMLALGVFEYKGQYNVMLLDGWSEHLPYPDLRKKAREEFKSVYGEEDGGQHAVDWILIEDKSSGISLRQDLTRASVPVRAYNPGRADKKQRVHLITPLLEAGVLWIPESKATPTQPVKWARDIIKQWKTFPNAAHDDYVDCITQALIYLHDTEWLSIDPAPEEPEEEAWEKQRRVDGARNPYSRIPR